MHYQSLKGFPEQVGEDTELIELLDIDLEKALLHLVLQGH